jgi:hypothetical protein
MHTQRNKKNWGHAARGPSFAKLVISAKSKISVVFFAKVIKTELPKFA